MPRIDLNVPYAEKDLAKQLGALWDKEKRVWYVPDGVDPLLLRRWLPRTVAELEQALLKFINMVEFSYGRLTAELDDLRGRIATLEDRSISPFRQRLQKKPGRPRRIRRTTRQG